MSAKEVYAPDKTWVKAEYAWEAKASNQLAFNRGEIIIVGRKQDSGWWEGFLRDRTGWFPSNYCEPTNQEPETLTMQYYQEAMRLRGVSQSTAPTKSEDNSDDTSTQSSFSAELQARRDAIARKNAERQVEKEKKEKEDQKKQEEQQREYEQALKEASRKRGMSNEADRIAQERDRANEEKQEQERREKERLEKERLEKERLEKERQERERMEKERQERERIERAKSQVVTSKVYRASKKSVTLSLGNKIWFPDELEEWNLGTVEELKEDTVMVATHSRSGRIEAVGGDCVLYVDDMIQGGLTSLDFVDDLCLLTHIHEAPILSCLRRRFEQQKMYTSIGTQVLISVNPYKWLAINEKSKRKEYINREQGELAPHLFAIADSAFRHMISEASNQSLIVSGESGAGKTEACKLVMEFMGDACALRNAGSGDAELVERLMNQIIQSNPMLEAFGNAKTTRNNNSSRFGKFLQIQFDKSGRPKGARCVQYLLEKTRVVSQNKNERNFHIFYQLCAGTSNNEREKLRLSSASSFDILSECGCLSVEGVDDAAEFIKTKQAMKVIGISEANISNLVTTLSCILHIGNLDFEQKAEGQPCVLKKGDIQFVSQILGVDSAWLLKALTQKEIQARGESFHKINDRSGCMDARDTLAKSVYSKLFEWIFAELNQLISAAIDYNLVFIGILDICGFEIFPTNSFEQLCINYCNERLALGFIQVVFRLEQEEYAAEGITWEEIRYNDNSPCIDLIESKSDGVIVLLDEECNFPKATDKSLVDKFNARLTGNQRYEKPRLLQTSFIIYHYAGEVTYDATGFLEKNRDSFPQDLQDVIESSENMFIRELFTSAATTPSKGTQPTRAQTKKSVISKFKQQLEELMNTLQSTTPHYVRCIKPNEQKSSTAFQGNKVAIQLRCNNIPETVKLRQLGWTYRRPFNYFYDRFWVVDPRLPHPKASNNSIENSIKTILQSLSASECQLGRTKVFIRSAKSVHQLESKRFAVMNTCASVIKAHALGIMIRSVHLKKKALSVVIQSKMKKAVYRRRFQLKQAAVANIKRYVCAYKPRLRWKKATFGFRRAKSIVKSKKPTLLWRSKKAATLQLKARIVRKLLEKRRKGICVLQAFVRRKAKYRPAYFIKAFLPHAQAMVRRLPWTRWWKRLRRERNVLGKFVKALPLRRKWITTDRITAASEFRSPLSKAAVHSTDMLSPKSPIVPITRKASNDTATIHSPNTINNSNNSIISTSKTNNFASYNSYTNNNNNNNNYNSNNNNNNINSIPKYKPVMSAATAATKIKAAWKCIKIRRMYVHRCGQAQGYLYFHNEASGEYDRWWVLLRAGEFKVFHTERQNGLASVVKLTVDTDIVMPSSDPRVYGFQLLTTDRCVSLGCCTDKDRAQWVRAILYAIHKGYQIQRKVSTPVWRARQNQAFQRQNVIESCALTMRKVMLRELVPPIRQSNIQPPAIIGDKITARPTLEQRLGYAQYASIRQAQQHNATARNWMPEVNRDGHLSIGPPPPIQFPHDTIDWENDGYSSGSEIGEEAAGYDGIDSLLVSGRRHDFTLPPKRTYSDIGTQYEPPQTDKRTAQTPLIEAIRSLLPIEVPDWNPGSGIHRASPFPQQSPSSSAFPMSPNQQKHASEAAKSRMFSASRAFPTKQRILFLAQDSRIDELLEWTEKRRNGLYNHMITTVGSYVAAKVGNILQSRDLFVVERLADVARLLQSRQIDIFLFFWDPKQQLWQLHIDLLDEAIKSGVMVCMNEASADGVLGFLGGNEGNDTKKEASFSPSVLPPKPTRTTSRNYDEHQNQTSSRYKHIRFRLHSEAATVIQALARGWLTRRHQRFASC